MDDRSVLIVDDESSLRKVLAGLLKIRGYAPEPVATGQEAVDCVAARRHAVAIVDLSLGADDISGIEVIRQIKSVSPETECIVLTGDPSQEMADKAAAVGASSYLLKPFNIKELLATIAVAVQAAQRRTAETNAAPATPATPKNEQTSQSEAEAPEQLAAARARLRELADSILEAPDLDAAKSLAREMKELNAKVAEITAQIDQATTGNESPAS